MTDHPITSLLYMAVSRQYREACKSQVRSRGVYAMVGLSLATNC